LKKDPIVLFQDRYYIFIAVFMCVFLPMIIGATYGHTMGCLLLSGLLRLVLNHHFTFLINSLAHILGKQKYSTDNTSKDNVWLSFFTYGEGYHNFHHKYPGDYRNGIKWYDFDPSKWFVFLFSFLGWTHSLKVTASPIIEASKASTELKKIQLSLSKKKLQEEHTSTFTEIEKTLEKQYNIFFATIKAWSTAEQCYLKAKNNNISSEKFDEIKKNHRFLKQRFNHERKIWQSMITI